MLLTSANRNSSGTISDEKMRQTFERHLKDVELWLTAQPNITILDVNYNEVVGNPSRSAQMINDFLKIELEPDRMIGAVNQNLYRNRR